MQLDTVFRTPDINIGITHAIVRIDIELTAIGTIVSVTTNATLNNLITYTQPKYINRHPI